MNEIKCYTTEEAAKILKVYPDTVRRYIRQGKINAVKIGNRIRITETELKRILNFR